MWSIVIFLFQSTLPRRERLFCQFFCTFFKNFNPRSREGSDNFAPTESEYLSYFNPRSREGSDRIATAMKLSRLLFQSTLPRRERRQPICATHAITCLFQSTLPRRERPAVRWLEIKGTKFQSTLPRRERH